MVRVEITLILYLVSLCGYEITLIIYLSHFKYIFKLLQVYTQVTSSTYSSHFKYILKFDCSLSFTADGVRGHTVLED